MLDTSIQVPSELFALAESSHFEGKAELPVLSVGPDDYTFEAPLDWSVDVTNTGSAFLVSGTVTGLGVCSCSRCLDDVTFQFDGEIEGYFLTEGSDAAADDDEIGEDEFEVLPDDHVIDHIIPHRGDPILFWDRSNWQPLCKDCHDHKTGSGL